MWGTNDGCNRGACKWGGMAKMLGAAKKNVRRGKMSGMTNVWHDIFFRCQT